MKTIITAFTIFTCILVYRENEYKKDKLEYEQACIKIVHDCIKDVRVFKQEQSFIKRYHEVSEMHQVSCETTIQYWWLYFRFGFYLDHDKIWYTKIHPYTWGYSTSTIKVDGEYKYSFEFNSFSEHIYPICFGLTSTQNDTTYFTER